MRTTIAAAILLIGGASAAQAQSADPYHWCALYTGNGLGGASNCYFVTQAQCLATVSGVGGQCIPNPQNPPGAGMSPQRWPRSR
jgi:hypothetical protein